MLPVEQTCTIYTLQRHGESLSLKLLLIFIHIRTVAQSHTWELPVQLQSSDTEHQAAPVEQLRECNHADDFQQVRTGLFYSHGQQKVRIQSLIL